MNSEVSETSYLVFTLGALGQWGRTLAEIVSPFFHSLLPSFTGSYLSVENGDTALGESQKETESCLLPIL